LRPHRFTVSAASRRYIASEVIAVDEDDVRCHAADRSVTNQLPARERWHGRLDGLPRLSAKEDEAENVRTL
jgi:hypothetical protein